jgi:hypothetical protein
MGRRFSADAFLEGLDKIKEEVAKSRTLNPAYIPILQNISPGEIQNCINARLFSQKLVREWLVKYKFKYWEKHTSTGKEVTHDEKVKQAGEIAEALCDHSRWLTHNRSINMVALEQLGLKIEDYTKDPDLNDAVTRYYTLLKMSFDMANIYKVFETPTSQVMRIVAPIAPLTAQKQVGCADVNFKCPKCGKADKIQANLGKHFDLKPGRVMYPLDTNVLKCDNCGTENDLLPIRLQLEARSGSKVVP